MAARVEIRVAEGHRIVLTGFDGAPRHCLAVALAPDVTVNCIAPGLVEGTRMAERLPEAMKQSIRAQAVLGRLGSADDIAQMAVAYCLADSVAGQTVVVDGGIPGAPSTIRANTSRRVAPR
jgi:NAD(P)-dependent dehydrogenase (short-subunit alcohol dehydrogenase family)